MKFITFAQLKSEKGIPYTRRHIANLVQAGKFPRPVQLSEARIAWVETEVDTWQAEKAAQRRPDAV